MDTYWNCSEMNATKPCQWEAKIGLGDGLVPPGNKPLPEPVVTQIDVAIWRH